MKSLFRFVIVFLALTGTAVLATRFLGVEFGAGDFWDHHGIFFLVFITLFPRLTLFFSSVPFGGLFWWLGWFFAPRLLVAILATLTYWNQNPFLVVIAWMVSLGGESSEKYVMVQRSRSRWQGRAPAKGFGEAKWVDAEVKE